jgi:shikimate kinase
MGTGKTSVGKSLGKKLNCAVVDIDRLIEEREKRKISEIFEADGEARFRAIEKEVIRVEAAKEGLVITTGGGAVMDPENLSALRANGWIVALLATPQTIYERVSHSRHRPLLNNTDMMGEIRRLLAVREPVYRQSDFQLNTDGCAPDDVAELILETLKDKL